MSAERTAFLKAIKPYRQDLVVGVECMFTWYWLADVCDEEETYPLSSDTPIYMKAIHRPRGDLRLD